MKTERGGALLAVMWLAAGLSAIAFSVANTVRGETERAETSRDAVRAHYLAAGAIDQQARAHPFAAPPDPIHIAAQYRVLEAAPRRTVFQRLGLLLVRHHVAQPLGLGLQLIEALMTFVDIDRSETGTKVVMERSLTRERVGGNGAVVRNG